MAIYTYRCKGCGKDEEVWQLISEYCAAPRVPYCDCAADGIERGMERYLTPIQISGDMQAFVSPIDGTVVNGRAGRREHMLRHNVVPTDEIMPDIIRNRKQFLADTKKGVRDDIQKSIAMVNEGYVPRPEMMASATAVSVPE